MKYKLLITTLLCWSISSSPAGPKNSDIFSKIKDMKAKQPAKEPVSTSASPAVVAKPNPSKPSTDQTFSQMTDIPETKFDINEMCCYINVERRLKGAPPVTISSLLSRLALSHSQDQAFSKNMTHASSNGNTLKDRIDNIGYSGMAFGENVAWNQRTVPEVMKGWVNSPGHYKNLINPKYNEFGSSCATWYWTQVFGADNPKSNQNCNCPGFENRESLLNK